MRGVVVSNLPVAVSLNHDERKASWNNEGLTFAVAGEVIEASPDYSVFADCSRPTFPELYLNFGLERWLKVSAKIGYERRQTAGQQRGIARVSPQDAINVACVIRGNPLLNSGIRILVRTRDSRSAQQ